VFPFALVPAAANDPLAGRSSLGFAGHEIDDFLPAGCLGEVELAPRVAETEEVAVPFDKAWHRHAASEVDHSRRRTH
jgi:hypothetical protein